MVQVNQAMAQCLAGCMASTAGAGGGAFNGWDVITSVCPLPAVKLVTCAAAPAETLGSAAQVLQTFVEQHVPMPDSAQYRR